MPNYSFRFMNCVFNLICGLCQVAFCIYFFCHVFFCAWIALCIVLNDVRQTNMYIREHCYCLTQYKTERINKPQSCDSNGTRNGNDEKYQKCLVK